MTERTFVQRRTGEDGYLPYCEAGSGETIVAIIGDGGLHTRAHALLAERRRVIVFAMEASAASPQETARRVAAEVVALGIDHFDLMGEGAGAAAAVWLALESEAEVGSIVLAAPDGLPDEAFREIKRPVLVLSGTKDASDYGEHYRTVLLDCHFMFVYDASPAIAPSGRKRSPSLPSSSSSGAVSSW
jgi:pimeloyl-ACP methyl ester carboxylesterase